MTITFLPSPYQTAGRQGNKIDSIVVHWMDGTLASTDAEFAHGSRRVSAHYGIEEAVKHQYVLDENTAWGAGNWQENLRCINIEHSADPYRPASALTITTSVALMADLCRKYSIDPARIFPHSKFYPTRCPGTLPLADMIARVRAALSGPAAPLPPVLTVPPVKPAPPVSARNVPMVKAIQSAVHVTADGAWGSETSRAATVVIRRVLTDVRYAQARVGAYPDGVWGPKSEAARTATIRRIQTAIGVTADGIFGPRSEAAWLRAYVNNFKKY